MPEFVVNKGFFDVVRKHLFKGKMNQEQVDGCIAVLEAAQYLPIEHRAYLLATTYHETAFTMQPITEYGGVRYFDKYDTGRLAKALGNTPEADGDGYRYRGRGYVMITGTANYRKASKKTGVDILSNPDLALREDVAARILVQGCSEGWFTSKKLDDYLPGDYVNARRVVNGTDDAHDIAAYAEIFERAIRQAESESPAQRPTPEQPEVTNPLIAIFNAIAMIIRQMLGGRR